MPPAAQPSPAQRKYPQPAAGGICHWRRERDSNPRDPFGPFGFQDRRNRPLCHLSSLRASRRLRGEMVQIPLPPQAELRGCLAIPLGRIQRKQRCLRRQTALAMPPASLRSVFLAAIRCFRRILGRELLDSLLVCRCVILGRAFFAQGGFSGEDGFGQAQAIEAGADDAASIASAFASEVQAGK